MIYSFSDLINAITVGFSCIGIGYMIGFARAKRISKQKAEQKLPFLIYDRDS